MIAGGVIVGAVVVGALAAVAAGLAVQPPPVRRLAAVVPAWRAVPDGDRRLSRSWLAWPAGIALAVLWMSAGPAPTTLIVLAASVGALGSRRAQARRVERRLRTQVCEFCRSLASELRTGASAMAALRGAAGAAPQQLRAHLRPVVDAAEPGDVDEVADALARAAGAAAGLAGLRRLGACWRVVIPAGAMTAAAVDRVADALADEIDLEQALAAALAGPRATWRLLSALPVAGVLLGVAVGADPLGFLLGSPAGLCCLVGAGLLDAAGLAWARRIGQVPAQVG